MTSTTYLDYGKRATGLAKFALSQEGFASLPTKYEDFLGLSQQTRKLIGRHLPLVLSDNYEHFMACLPHKDFAAHHILIRKQIGGFTIAAGFWKLLEFLSHQMTHDEVDLVADFFSGKHNGYPRQFDKEYWHKTIDRYNGYLPLRIETVGEGATFTGVPFPVAQIYGETPAVWLNEPMYIQTGHLSHVATIAGQFASILGDPFRFIEVMFRALHNSDESDDVLLAMLIGGGIISTSNDLGAFINGEPFKSAGTTGHCWYQQFETLKKALRVLLGSPLGRFSTALLDLYDHKHGFEELMELIAEGLPAPFAIRPDSGDTLALAMHDMTVLQDQGKETNTVIEDGKKPKDVRDAEKLRRQNGLDKNRMLHGGGSAFIGPRKDLEAAYKSCYFHNGTPDNPHDKIDTMKICLDDQMKQSIPGMVQPFFNPETGFYTLGTKNEQTPSGSVPGYEVLFDNLSNPGYPYFNPAYNPQRLATCKAVTEGVNRSLTTRNRLGPAFILDVEPNRTMIRMTKALRDKRQEIYDRALEAVKK